MKGCFLRIGTVVKVNIKVQCLRQFRGQGVLGRLYLAQPAWQKHAQGYPVWCFSVGHIIFKTLMGMEEKVLT